MESNSNVTKEDIWGYVNLLIKLRDKNLIFPIKILWKALNQSNIK